MPRILLNTEIDAAIDICFDMARSIDLHAVSMSHTGERAVGGRTSGLIGLNEAVTWEATHLGIKQRLTSKITAYNRPYYFRDEQQRGAFRSFSHEHIFEQAANKVVMTDVFDFQSPLGILGRWANTIYLTRYMRALLEARNRVVKDYCESGKWRDLWSE